MNFYQKLLFTGDWPRTLLDVGAHLGFFSSEFIKKFPLCKPTLIEANPQCQPALEKLNYPFKIFAASDRNSTETFYINKLDPTSTGNSLFRENTNHYRDENLRAIEIPLKTLDSEFPHQTFDFIKIDVQGGELDVINGATRLLQSAKHVLIEVSLVDYNHKAPRADVVLQRMHELGFEMKEILEYHQKPELYGGCIFQLDILFQNQNSKNSQRAILAPEGWREPLIDYLKTSRQENKSFSVIDIGSGTNPWSADFADASFDKMPSPHRLQFHGDLNRESDWQQVLNYVQKNGRFSYAICSHTLEDLANPEVTLLYLSLIADAGFIAVPSIQTELSKIENGPWTGFIHHRWLVDYDSDQQEMVFFPKLPLIEHFPPAPKTEGKTELQVFWRGRPQFRMANGGYMGPSVDVVAELYQNQFLRKGPL